MKNNSFFKFLIFILIIFNASLVHSNEKFYFIDMDFIVNNSLAGKSIIKQLTEKNNSINKTFKELEQDLKKEEDNIISKKNLLNEEEFNIEVNNFNKKVSEYKLNRNETLKKVDKQSRETQNILLSSLTDILTEYSGKNSISFIFDKKSMIIGKTEFDLSKIILEILDSKIKKIQLK